MAASGGAVPKPHRETKQGREQQTAPARGAVAENCRINQLSAAGCGKILANGPWEDKAFLLDLHQGGRTRLDCLGRKPLCAGTPMEYQAEEQLRLIC